jgi:hypothetical protein
MAYSSLRFVSHPVTCFSVVGMFMIGVASIFLLSTCTQPSGGGGTNGTTGTNGTNGTVYVSGYDAIYSGVYYHPCYWTGTSETPLVSSGGNAD